MTNKTNKFDVTTINESLIDSIDDFNENDDMIFNEIMLNDDDFILMFDDDDDVECIDIIDDIMREIAFDNMITK
jgi:hypothetical protein